MKSNVSLVAELDALLAAVASGSQEAPAMTVQLRQRLAEVDAARAKMSMGRQKTGAPRRRDFVRAWDACMKAQFDKLPAGWQERKDWKALRALIDPTPKQILEHWPVDSKPPESDSQVDDLIEKYGEYITQGKWAPGFDPEEE